MSFAVNIATAAAAANQARIQMAVAAKIAKMNAASERSVVQLIESANANMRQAVSSALAPGTGTSLDISA